MTRLSAFDQAAFAPSSDDADTRAAMHALHMAGDFVRQGWAVQENFLNGKCWRELAAEAQGLWQQGRFGKAGIGREAMHRVQAGIRGDDTLWLDEPMTPVACRFVTRELEALRLALNASTYLGLFEFEGHLAAYPTGACYARHLDQLRGTETRQVSVALYLNDTWQTADGGELRLYPPGLDGAPADSGTTILPRGGTLLIFASAGMPHEVRPAKRTRFSLSGWFRRRA